MYVSRSITSAESPIRGSVFQQRTTPLQPEWSRRIQLREQGLQIRFYTYVVAIMASNLIAVLEILNSRIMRIFIYLYRPIQ